MLQAIPISHFHFEEMIIPLVPRMRSALTVTGSVRDLKRNILRVHSEERITSVQKPKGLNKELLGLKKSLQNIKHFVACNRFPWVMGSFYNVKFYSIASLTVEYGVIVVERNDRTTLLI